MSGDPPNSSFQPSDNKSNASDSGARSIRSVSLGRPVGVGEYLIRRLHEVGIKSVHGAPLARNTNFINQFAPSGLLWTESCNENDAGGAADGYARIKGISALVTSHGSGELSSINAIAAAYAEYVPIIHIIIGQPLASHKNGRTSHNVLSNSSRNTCMDMFRSISCVVVELIDPFEIPHLIDHAIRECRFQSQPVYIALPADMITRQIEGERLRQPMETSPTSCDAKKIAYVVEVILRYLDASQNAIILVDARAIRHRAVYQVHDLARVSGLPTFVTPMGKGAVTESLPNYCGVYAGDSSENAIRRRVETADLILNIGAAKMDFTTPSFTYRASGLNTIDIHSDSVRIKYSEYTELGMRDVLLGLIDRIEQISLAIVPGPTLTSFPSSKDIAGDQLTHAWFWKSLTQFLKPNDIVITESGLANTHIWQTRFPENIVAINQYLWSGRGYALPSCYGAALAARDFMREHPSYRSRIIMFTDSASLPATASTLSSIVRQGLKPIIFVFCKGETTTNEDTGQWPPRKDSAIEVPSDHCSDSDTTPLWSFRDLVPAMGAKEHSHQTCTVHTKRQTLALFADRGFAAASCLQLVELHMAPVEAEPH